MATAGEKDPGALLTIGELSRELGIPQHILRYWETRFPQLRPMQRAGNRRYYRPADVELARRIHRLLNEEGYTVRGVQKLLRERHEPEAPPPAAREPDDQPVSIMPVGEPQREPEPGPPRGGIDVYRLIALRNRLAAALER